mmetsp:Transcript_58/g.244  ORF Transcript_58/g.244 Transcript_58/m.244 type:complete len:208 (-) Transcript_58:874-1497(-)
MADLERGVPEVRPLLGASSRRHEPSLPEVIVQMRVGRAKRRELAEPRVAEEEGRARRVQREPRVVDGCSDETRARGDDAHTLARDDARCARHGGDDDDAVDAVDDGDGPHGREHVDARVAAAHDDDVAQGLARRVLQRVGHQPRAPPRVCDDKSAGVIRRRRDGMPVINNRLGFVAPQHGPQPLHYRRHGQPAVGQRRGAAERLGEL